MHPTDNLVRRMPDIASDAAPVAAGVLDWVGMDRIDLPVRLLGQGGVAVQYAARVAAYVNLQQPEVRGIHMSRLYLHLDNALSSEPLTPSSLRRLLRDFLDSHVGLSDRAMLRIAFDQMLRRLARASEYAGWKAYPVWINGLLESLHAHDAVAVATKGVSGGYRGDAFALAAER